MINKPVTYRLLLVLAITLAYTIDTHAQLVTTIAGQVDSSGLYDGPALNGAVFNNPHGISVLDDGTLIIADRFSNSIRRMDPNGIVTTIAGTGLVGDDDGPGNAATFHRPYDVVVDKNDNIYVSDYKNHKIRKIDPFGNVTTFAGSGIGASVDGFGTSAAFKNPGGLEIDTSGNIYVCDVEGHCIRRITPQGFVTTIAGTPGTLGYADGTGTGAQFHRPYGVTFDNEWRLIVADEANHRIRRVTTNGVVTTIAGTGVLGSLDGDATVAQFHYPWDTEIDTAGNIYVMDGYNFVIRKITTDGNVSTFVGLATTQGAVDGIGTQASFNGATGLAYHDPTGCLFVADAYNELIRKVLDIQGQNVGIVSVPNTNNICVGDTISITAFPETYAIYDFYIGTQLSQSSTSNTFQTHQLPVGSHNIYVIATDGGMNQFVSNSLIVNVNPIPDPNVQVVGDTVHYSAEDSTILVAPAGYTYIWSTGATTQSIVVNDEGDYTVQITGGNGCAATSDPIAIKDFDDSVPPQISINGPSSLCPGEQVVLQTNINSNIQWLHNGWPIQNEHGQQCVVTEEGLFQVQTVNSQSQTLTSDPIEVLMNDAPEADFSADRVKINPTDNEVQFSSTVSNASSYFWNFGDPSSGVSNTSTLQNPVHIFEDPGAYSVLHIVENEFGCRDTASKVDFIYYDNNIFIPSAFTPNGDGMNDAFLVRGVNIDAMNMKIFNQWGEQIFETDDLALGWNGRRNGDLVQNGTYVFLIMLELSNGDSPQFEGHITLVR